MLDPRNDMLPPPTSPTNSSVSSSDLDTESTGSFFHDRSTTLGTLMGVNFPAITFRAPSQQRDGPTGANSAGGGSNRGNKGRRARRTLAELRRRRWWRLCSDAEAKPASLGEFLEVERRFGDGAFFGEAAAELEGAMVAAPPRDGRVLFADGRVLPPATEVENGSSPAGILCSRFPVSLTGICSGGAG